MSYYIFNVKKGEVTLEIQSLDSRFAYKQADKLFSEALTGSPAKVLSRITKSQEVITEAPKKELLVTKQEVNIPAKKINKTQPKVQPVTTFEPIVVHKEQEDNVPELPKSEVPIQVPEIETVKALELVVPIEIVPEQAFEVEEELQPLEQVDEIIPAKAVEEVEIKPDPKKEPKQKAAKKLIEKEPELVKIVEPEPFEVQQEEAVEEIEQAQPTELKQPEKETEPPINNDDIFAEIIEFQKKKLNLQSKTQQKAPSPQPEVEKEAPALPQVEETINNDEETTSIIDSVELEEEINEVVVVAREEKIQETEEEPKVEEEIITEIAKQVIEQETKPVQSSLELEEFNIKTTVRTEEPEEEPAVVEPSLQVNDFYSVLQQKIFSMPELNLGNSPSVATAKSLEEASTVEDFVEIKKPKTLLDYLLITAYYLKEKEYFDRYSLKQINSKAIRYTGKPIDHSIIQEAVTQNYIEVVPDYTGTADVTEYSITPEGENYVINGLK